MLLWPNNFFLISKDFVWRTGVSPVLAGGTPGAVKRAPRIAQQPGSGPVIFLRVTVGRTEILHSGVWLGTQGELAGRPVGKLTKLSSETWRLKTKKTTMTSTNMFQGLDNGSKTSSRWRICSRVAWWCCDRNGLTFRCLIFSVRCLNAG